MAPDQNVCDEKVFDGLFRSLSKDLHNFLYYKFGADNNPKDLVQEAFIKLWNNSKKVTPEKAKAFLFTVANNQMLNELAKKKTALNYSLDKPKAYTSESPDYLMEENEYMVRLQTAIENLTEDQRGTCVRNLVEGKKHQEIADMLEISRSAVMTQLFRARQKLQKVFREEEQSENVANGLP